MPSFADSLRSGRFLVTAELTPPKGTDLSDLIAKAEALRDRVDAFNLTDSASAVMTMAPIAAAVALKQRGMEAIMQVTGRDRNRIALQADLLAAAALGVSTILCMGGDPPTSGDHPEAKPVFDLDTMGLLRAVAALDAGKDLMGHPLKGAAHLCAGAVVNPGAADVDKELARMEEKVEAGARFFQTQAVYDAEAFERFMAKAQRFGVPVLAGFILLKSAEMARRLNATLPGVCVPQSLIDELEGAQDRPAKSVEIGGRIIGALRGLCQGVHIMAIGWEARIPAVLDAAGIGPRAS